jgi:hypothetical protein
MTNMHRRTFLAAGETAVSLPPFHSRRPPAPAPRPFCSPEMAIGPTQSCPDGDPCRPELS